MAAKRLNLPPMPSTVASSPLSNAPLLPPPGGSSLARDNDDDGSDIHRCSCYHVVVVLVLLRRRVWRGDGDNETKTTISYKRRGGEKGYNGSKDKWGSPPQGVVQRVAKNNQP